MHDTSCDIFSTLGISFKNAPICSEKNMGCKVVQASIMGLYGAGSLIKLNFAELLDDKRPNAGLCQPYTSDEICMIHSAR